MPKQLPAKIRLKTRALAPNRALARTKAAVHAGLTPVVTLDHFLIEQIFNKINPHLFSKQGIYIGLRGKLPQAERFFGQLPEKPRSNQHSAVRRMKKIVFDALKKHGAVYVKTTAHTAGAALGSLKISLEYNAPEGTVVVTIPSEITRKGVLKSLDRLQGTSESVSFFHDAFTHDSKIRIPIHAIVQRLPHPQPLERIIGVVVQHCLEPGTFVVEPALPIARFKGMTTEIRHFVQVVDGKPRVMSEHGKMGVDFSNHMTGGRKFGARHLIRGILQEHLGVSRTEAQQQAEQFFEESKKLAVRATRVFNAYMKQAARRHLHNFDTRHVYARTCAVDVVPVFRNKQLHPVLMELQYPVGTGSFYFAPDKEREKIAINEARLAKKDAELLKELF